MHKKAFAFLGAFYVALIQDRSLLSDPEGEATELYQGVLLNYYY